MAKRFTESEIWNDKWYHRLSMTNKLIWRYICDTCDIAGVWETNDELLAFQIGMKGEVNLNECLKAFNAGKERIIVQGEYWILVDFIRFQYGTLNDNVRFHKKIKVELRRFGDSLCDRLLNRLSNSLQEQEQDKEQVKDSIQGGAGGKVDGYTLEHCLEAADKLNIPASEAEAFHLHYCPVGWIDGAGRKITNLPRMLQKWHSKQIERPTADPHGRNLIYDIR